MWEETEHPGRTSKLLVNITQAQNGTWVSNAVRQMMATVTGIAGLELDGEALAIFLAV